MSTVVVLHPPEVFKGHGYSRLRVPVAFHPPLTPRSVDALPIPHFQIGDSRYVLVRDLARLWNYPSSYQLMARILKQTGLDKGIFKKSTPVLNAEFVEQALIDEAQANVAMFYVDLSTITATLGDISQLHKTRAISDEPRRRPITDEGVITVSQIFPQYGIVPSVTPLTHSTFLLLNPVTKLQIYKHEGTYRRVYGTSVSAGERELLVRANNYTNLGNAEDQTVQVGKPLVRSKRAVGNLDPNTLDVTENLMPGCGLIPEFSVLAISKVPNYFITTGATLFVENQHRPHLPDLEYDDDSKPRQGQLANNEELLQSKYFYYKSYRGPGLGNYKDAALVSRINRIRTFSAELAPQSNDITHLPLHKVAKRGRAQRLDRPAKGLLHDFYLQSNVDHVTRRQRHFTEDFTNLEMLHSTVLFNVLVNTYRSVAEDTWLCFYKFKGIDFEKLYNIVQVGERRQRRNELLEATRNSGVPPGAELQDLLRDEMINKFTLPLDHKEIMRKLPVLLRDGDEPVTALSRPLRYVATYPDPAMPELLRKVELVKLPNANSLGWDNIKVYRRD